MQFCHRWPVSAALTRWSLAVGWNTEAIFCTFELPYYRTPAPKSPRGAKVSCSGCGPINSAGHSRVCSSRRHWCIEGGCHVGMPAPIGPAQLRGHRGLSVTTASVLLPLVLASASRHVSRPAVTLDALEQRPTRPAGCAHVSNAAGCALIHMPDLPSYICRICPHMHQVWMLEHGSLCWWCESPDVLDMLERVADARNPDSIYRPLQVGAFVAQRDRVMRTVQLLQLCTTAVVEHAACIKWFMCIMRNSETCMPSLLRC